MLLGISMHNALWGMCLAVNATTTDTQIASMAEEYFPSRQGMNEYTRVYHMGIACRNQLIREENRAKIIMSDEIMSSGILDTGSTPVYSTSRGINGFDRVLSV